MIASINANTCSNIETVRLLINAGSDIHCQNVNGWTSLMLACKYSCTDSNLETINVLLDSDTQINADQKINNKTCLMMLLKYGTFDSSSSDMIIKLLHIFRKTLLYTDTKGKSAYDYYVQNGSTCLDAYYLKILKGDISLNNTKSARLL